MKRQSRIELTYSTRRAEPRTTIVHVVEKLGVCSVWFECLGIFDTFPEALDCMEANAREYQALGFETSIVDARIKLQVWIDAVRAAIPMDDMREFLTSVVEAKNEQASVAVMEASRSADPSP